MKEDFLHYIWRYQKLNTIQLQSTDKENIEVVMPGQYIQEAGPDFFAAHLVINGQKWVGNVEVHVKASDWYAHRHEEDANYDNVILHVVWEHDMDVMNKNNVAIPTLCLAPYVPEEVFAIYQNTFVANRKSGIPCASLITTVPDFKWQNWLERLYIERLEQKSIRIRALLKETKNNWEAVLFILLMRYFGSTRNGDVFEEVASRLDYTIIQHCRQHQLELEALLFGQLGMLPESNDDMNSYVRGLLKEYQFLTYKYNLTQPLTTPVQFFKLRPPNFPTIRIAQLVSAYTNPELSFRNLMEYSDYKEISALFQVDISDFWKTHYTFSKVSARRNKNLTPSFVQLIVINVVLPLRFVYTQYKGNDEFQPLFDIAQHIPPETNTIVTYYNQIGSTCSSALHSQALIQLKQNFCDTKSCMRCTVGTHILASG